MYSLQLALDHDLSEEALKILFYLQENLFGRNFYFFGNLADLECISAILSKAYSTTDFFPYANCKIVREAYAKLIKAEWCNQSNESSYYPCFLMVNSMASFSIYHNELNC